jgi:hypothetical protein
VTRWLKLHWLHTALLGLFAGLLAWELLLPGFIGLADNGDFGKVCAHLRLAAERPTNFVYVQPVVVRSERNYWESPYYSSETALAWLALHLSGAAHEGGRFHIRWMGAFHAALCTAALAFLLRALTGLPLWAQLTIAAFPVLIFTDACYAAYLNTFYMDAMALCSLLLMTGIAVWIVVANANRTGPILMFAAAALMFVLSKTQHAVWMMLPAAFLATRRRPAGWIAAAFVMLAGIGMLATSDLAYRGQAMFNVFFFRIAPEGPAARQDLLAMGVLPGELRYTGMHSYVDGAPTANRQWTEEFYRRTGFGRLLGWYTHHPARTFYYLHETLTQGAPEMRVSLGNYPEGQGHAPGERTTRLSWWSTARSALLRAWPWHIVLWWALFFGGCVATMLRGTSSVARQLAAVAMGIGILGVGEFSAAALADCLDPGRHLFLFQVCTELSLCFAVAAVVGYASIRHTP